MSEVDRALELYEESTALEAEGDLAGAEAKCREAIAIFEREEGPASPDVANLLHSLGLILEREGKFQEAAECGRRAAGIIEPLVPAFDGPDGQLILIHSLELLGNSLRQMGAYAEAEPTLVRAVELAETLPDQTETLINALNNFGVLCKFAGWFDRGEAVYSRAIGMARPLLGERHETVAALLHNIGGLEHARGRYGLAEEPSRRAWDIRRELLGEDHVNALADAVAYAAVLDGLERYAESRPIYEHALEVYERVLGPRHYEVAATLHNLAVVEQAQGNLARAAELGRRSVSIKRELLGDSHPDTALSAMNLGAILLESGDAAEARRLCSGALATLERTLAPEHPHIAVCRGLVEGCGEPKITG